MDEIKLTMEPVETVPAGDVTLSPIVMRRGAALVMGGSGYDYGSGSTMTLADTTIGELAAKKAEVAVGSSMIRIKHGGVTGAGDERVYVSIVLRNDSAFAVNVKYEIESYGTIWGPDPMTLEAGETVVIPIVVQGLGSDQTPYHRILFTDGAAAEGTAVSFCGFLMERASA